jgi:hypothetical protein
MEPISIQLMDPNCNPINARAYTVPRSVEPQLQAEQENSKISGDRSPWRRLFLWMGFNNIYNIYMILCFADFNNTFHLYTDASDHQLGTVIMLDKNPLTISSQNLNTAQYSSKAVYSHRDWELFINIETRKENKNILLGHHKSITVFTYHENNTFNGLNIPNWVLCWLSS